MSAQSPEDTISLKEVEIKENKIPGITGFKVTAIDSVTLSQNSGSGLSELIGDYSPVFIRKYNSGLATSSFRGAGSTHTQVLWNGININSPMLGQTDFSLLPAFFIDDILIYHGGGSLSNNSGAIGGSINLFNNPDWNQRFGLKIAEETGSFGAFNNFLSLSAGSRFIQSRTRMLLLTSENNYVYTDPADSGKIKRLENAEFTQVGIIQELYAKANRNNFVSAKIWLQQNDRNLPPVPGNEKLSQQSFRATADWNRYGDKAHFTYFSAYLYDYYHYLNKNILTDSRNKSYSLTNHIDYSYSLLKKIKWVSGVNLENIKVVTNNYDQNRYRDVFSLSTGFSGYVFSRLSMFIFCKGEWVDKKMLPLIPSLGLDFEFPGSNPVHLKANVAGNFHVPTLNDLYWTPGGNSALNPESGYTGEFGLYKECKTKNNFRLRAEVTGFASVISGWIQWLPHGNSYWTPENVKEVFRRGAEASLKTDFKISILNFSLGGNYAFTKATNQKTTGSAGNSLGKQVIYVPLHSFNSFLRLWYGNYFLTYTLDYTGKRYIYSDNSWYMPSYFLSDILAGRNFKLRKVSLTVKFRINNILNKQYQAIINQPMPGINYNLAITFNFSK